MALKSLFAKIDVELVGVRTTIVESLIKPIMWRANALYEFIWDQPPPPGSGTQTYEGHDHGLHGGAPIARGSGICEDGGENPLHTYAPTQIRDRRALSDDDSVTATSRNGSAPLFKCATSWESTAGRFPWTAKVLVAYRANKANFTLYWTEQSAKGAGREFALLLPQTPSEAKQQWAVAVGAPLAHSQCSNIHIEAENDSYDAADPCTLDIYGIWTVETYDATVRDRDGVVKP